MNKNSYYILGIPKTSSQSEIKNAYRKLIMQYHPDKNNSSDAHDKFIEIQTAYELLINDKTKYIYDELDEQQKIDYYEFVKKYVTEYYPDLGKYVNNLIKTIYDNHGDFKEDIVNVDLDRLYNKLLEKFPNIIHKYIPVDNIIESTVNIVSNLDIMGHINVSTKDIYDGKYARVKIHRLSKHTFVSVIPLDSEKVEFLYEGEGEVFDKMNGNAKIYFVINNRYENMTYYFDKLDVYTETEITLYQYLYGGCFKFTYLDDSVVEVDYVSMINKIPIICLDDRGMKNKNNGVRGKLFISFKIKNVDDIGFMDKIKNT